LQNAERLGEAGGEVANPAPDEAAEGRRTQGHAEQQQRELEGGEVEEDGLSLGPISDGVCGV
jgi:hypothetical protein